MTRSTTACPSPGQRSKRAAARSTSTFSDGTPIWARAIQLGVTTLREGYGEDVNEYLKSPYPNEFVTPNRAFDTISSTCSVGGLDPRAAASLQFWHAHPTRRVFGERETTLLRLLRPAFLAGVRTELAWRSSLADLLETLDALRVPALIGDTAGAEIHQTPALDAVLRDEPERDLVRRAMLDLLSRARTMGKGGAEACARAARREVDTRGARYRLWACLHARSRAAARPLVVVSLEPAQFSGCSHEALRERFGLTAAELRVCLLLARGRSNAKVDRRHVGDALNLVEQVREGALADRLVGRVPLRPADGMHVPGDGFACLGPAARGNVVAQPAGGGTSGSPSAASRYACSKFRR